jgi:hypothetical protein
VEQQDAHQRASTRLSIEFDPSCDRIAGRVLAEQELRRFEGWMQLAALLDEVNGAVAAPRAARPSNQKGRSPCSESP